MKTDKTGLEQLIEWADKLSKEFGDKLCPIDAGYVAAKARTLLASEKSAMEKAQEAKTCDGCEFKSLDHHPATCPKTWDGRIRCPEKAQGPSPDYVIEKDKQMKAALGYCEDIAKQNDELKKKLEKKDISNKGSVKADIDFCDYHIAIGASKGEAYDVLKERLLMHTEEVPSKDPQTQVQQLIQFAKDNGYGLAAEWMESKNNKEKK